MTYTSILKKLTLTKWRWPLIPFAAVLLFCTFTFFTVLDAVFGGVFLVLLISGACLLFMAEVFNPNTHALIRARIAMWSGEVLARLARHPRIIATLRNPRWWVAFPAWSLLLRIRSATSMESWMHLLTLDCSATCESCTHGYSARRSCEAGRDHHRLCAVDGRGILCRLQATRLPSS